eukprot:Skav217954  [mRNA]  locus=scaffold3202:119160:119638:- [translate_table: standard]
MRHDRSGSRNGELVALPDRALRGDELVQGGIPVGSKGGWEPPPICSWEVSRKATHPSSHDVPYEVKQVRDSSRLLHREVDLITQSEGN